MLYIYIILYYIYIYVMALFGYRVPQKIGATKNSAPYFKGRGFYQPRVSDTPKYLGYKLYNHEIYLISYNPNILNGLNNQRVLL